MLNRKTQRPDAQKSKIIFESLPPPQPSETEQVYFEQVYFLGKARHVLSVIHYLNNLEQDQSLTVDYLTILYKPSGWLISIKPTPQWSLESILDLQAFITELGILYTPDSQSQKAFHALANGYSLVEVMNRYHVAVIDHGLPRTEELEFFRNKVIDGMGYCPETLA